jgi:hypothetical protein
MPFTAPLLRFGDDDDANSCATLTRLRHKRSGTPRSCGPDGRRAFFVRSTFGRVRSSRRLEAECRRNIEVMWLLSRLAPDYKSIAEFRLIHREAVTEAGAELVRFARSVGLVRGEWVAIDGSKFLAVSSARSVRERGASDDTRRRTGR